MWKIILGIFGLLGGLFAVNSKKSKEVQRLKKVIDDNKKEEKKVAKEIEKLEKDKKVTKREVGKLKRKLTISKKKTQKCKKHMTTMKLNQRKIFLEILRKINEDNYEDIEIFCDYIFCHVNGR